MSTIALWLVLLWTAQLQAPPDEDAVRAIAARIAETTTARDASVFHATHPRADA